MRTFTRGTGPERKLVILELAAHRLQVSQGTSGEVPTKKRKDFATEAEARSACDRMVGELLAKGFVERNSSEAGKPARVKAKSGVGASRADRAEPSSGEESAYADLFASAGEDVAEGATAVLPRLAPAPAAQADPRKKKGGKKKKKRKGSGGPESGDALDKRVIAGIGAGAVASLALLGFLGYDMFFKPASIVGSWEGSRTEHEIGKFLTHNTYALLLDNQKRAVMTREGNFTSKGTYALQDDRLKLSFPAEKDDDGEEVPGSEIEYKVTLGRATLDLYDPLNGKKVVQLIRMTRKVGAGAAPATPPPAPRDLAAGGGDPAADAGLLSANFSPADNAFRLRYPAGWATETGSRPDNMYSWVRLTKGSAKVQVFADIAGSLTSGPNNGNYEEGSELAPVHGAHERYKKNAAELYSDYQESEPALFKGSGLGEGRVATFTASGGRMFGGKIRGIRATLLTNDRRVSILCESPGKEFDGDKATFLAICRSLSR